MYSLKNKKEYFLTQKFKTRHWSQRIASCEGIFIFRHKNGGLTLFRKEWLRIGSSAAKETLLSMMKTRMRLVKMW